MWNCWRKFFLFLPKKNKNGNLGWGTLGDALKMRDAAYKLNLRKGARCFMAVRHYAGGGLGNLFFFAKVLLSTMA